MNAPLVTQEEKGRSPMNASVRRPARLLVMLTLAPALAHAAALRLNSPYPCGEGLTLTVTACGPVNGQTWCMIKLDKDGRTLRQSAGLERGIAKLINGCAVHAHGGPVPAAATTPAMNPSYLAAMPTVEKIQSLIKGTSSDDTLARQLAILTYLPQVIEMRRVDTRGYNSPKTPDELRILQSYRVAAWRISQSFAKSHTSAATSQFQHLEGHYEMDSKFYHAWYPALISVDFRAAYSREVAQDFSQLKAHAQQEVRAQQQARQQPAANGGFGAGSDHGGRDEVRKCMESGRSDMECLGEGLKASVGDLYGGNPLKGIVPPTPAGLRLIGAFASGNLQIVFSQANATLRCGTLEPQPRQYTIERRGQQVLVSLPTSPKPLVLAYRADGRLAGPGPVDIAGLVAIGPPVDHPTTYYQTHVASTSHPISAAEAEQSTESLYDVHDYGGDPHVEAGDTYEKAYQIHNYVTPTAPKTERCSAGVLAPTGATLRTSDVLTGLLGTQASESQNTAPGLRLNGAYASPDGLKIEFRGVSATLDCGAAHHSEGYVVRPEGGGLIARFQSATGPLALTVEPNGTLVGSGSVQVDGRLISGEGADGRPLYTPVSARCAIGTLTATR